MQQADLVLTSAKPQQLSIYVPKSFAEYSSGREACLAAAQR